MTGPSCLKLLFLQMKFTGQINFPTFSATSCLQVHADGQVWHRHFAFTSCKQRKPDSRGGSWCTALRLADVRTWSPEGPASRCWLTRSHLPHLRTQQQHPAFLALPLRICDNCVIVVDEVALDQVLPSSFRFSPANHHPPLLHTGLSPPHAVCDSPDQAVHYHTLDPNLGLRLGTGTWLL
jgi:hypothetical protein